MLGEEKSKSRGRRSGRSERWCGDVWEGRRWWVEVRSRVKYRGEVGARQHSLLAAAASPARWRGVVSWGVDGRQSTTNPVAATRPVVGSRYRICRQQVWARSVVGRNVWRRRWKTGGCVVCWFTQTVLARRPTCAELLHLLGSIT